MIRRCYHSNMDIWSDSAHQVLEALAPGWVGSLIGIVGIVAAITTYFLTRRRKLLAYRTRGMRLLGAVEAGLPNEVTVQYRGRNVPRLTRSFLIVWNAGEVTISGREVVGTDPLKIDLGDEAEILSASV